MFTKKEQIAARLILRSANQGRKVIKMDDLVAELQKEEESAFWGAASDAEKALSKFEAGNLIVKIDENTYRILADIAAIREFILRESNREAEEEVAAYDLDLEDIIGSTWTLVGEDRTEYEDGDEDDAEEKRERALLQARRLALVRQMQSELGENDEETQEKASDDEEDENGDDTPPAIHAISRNLDAGVSIIKSDEDYYIVLKGLETEGAETRFKILLQGDDIYFSDGGSAIHAIGDREFIDAEGINEKIGLILEHYHVFVVGDDLQIKVDSPQTALLSMMRLYTAMERIITIDMEDVATCVEHYKEDDRIWETVKELLEADSDLDRNAIVSQLKERYRGVKDAEDFDDIILFARGVKEFARMSDEDYLQSRGFLTGRWVSQSANAIGEDSDSAVAEPAGDRTKMTVLSQEAEKTANMITETLAGFHIDSEVANILMGPTVMRFDLDILSDAEPSSVIKRDMELAMRLRQRDGVRAYADTESGRICIEVPRRASEREKVRADGSVVHESAHGEKEDALKFALGKNVENEFVYGDLTQLKHILIGGASCSGKSTLLHTMIYSFITNYSPDDVRLILCDAKETEFARYSGMPHLLTGQIVTETEQMVLVLRWANDEMERRYRIFENMSAAGDKVRDIDDHNAACKEGKAKLPRIVIIADEIADLMADEKRDIEKLVRRLAQRSPAAGIYLVVATQHSFDATGLLKTNFPARIAFRMIQETDSRAILGESGAEKLLGLGDMLMRSGSDLRCERIQGAYVPYEISIETAAAMGNIYEAKFDEPAKKFIDLPDKMTASDASRRDRKEYSEDPLFIKALAIVVQEGEASVSLVRRKCRIGYSDAGKIVEWMENKGYISPCDGKAKARAVLLTKEQFIQLYGPL